MFKQLLRQRLVKQLGNLHSIENADVIAITGDLP